MKSNFETCLAKVLEYEGGYVNDPKDPGGETNYGISKRAYPNENIKGMTRSRAAVIYRRDYWNKVRGDDLPSGLDLVAFDAAVNSGVSRGAKWLQMALGVPADGVIGNKTLSAAAIAHPTTVINRACDYRMAFLRQLGTWGRFGKGWSNRVESVRAKSLAMSMVQAPAAPTTVSAGNGILAAIAAWFNSIFGVKQ